MRIVLQRVKKASVEIDNNTVGEISGGLLLFLGVTHSDTEKEADCLVDKIFKMRIFADVDEKMNKSIGDINGEVLIVSQFTLYADCKKGNRPSFKKAAQPEEAKRLYEYFVESFKNKGLKVETGGFGAYMDVSLVNDGPVTISIEI